MCMCVCLCVFFLFTCVCYLPFPSLQVAKLQRAHLKDPVKVEVSSKYQTVAKLKQSMLFVPCKHKVGVCVCECVCVGVGGWVGVFFSPSYDLR